MKTCQLHCTPKYTLGVYRSTGISVSDKVYKDLSSTLFPSVSVSNLGCTLGVYRSTGISVSEYTKTYQLDCSPVYQSITRDITACHVSGISVSDKVYENMSDIVYTSVSFSVSVNDVGYGRSGVYARVSTYL